MGRGLDGLAREQRRAASRRGRAARSGAGGRPGSASSAAQAAKPPSSVATSWRPCRPGGRPRGARASVVAVAVHDDRRDPAIAPFSASRRAISGWSTDAEPRGRERLRARDVAAARLAAEAPAVVGGDRPDVDDREGRVVEPATEVVGGDGRRQGGRFEDAHRVLQFLRVSGKQKPLPPAGVRGSVARIGSGRPRSDTPDAFQAGGATRTRARVVTVVHLGAKDARSAPVRAIAGSA